MAERFTDRVAVVTGASSGIGHAIAERLAAEEAGIEGLAKHLAGRGGEHGVRVNVVRPAASSPTSGKAPSAATACSGRTTRRPSYSSGTAARRTSPP